MLLCKPLTCLGVDLSRICCLNWGASVGALHISGSTPGWDGGIVRGTQVSPLAYLHLPSAFVVDLGGFWKHIHRTLYIGPLDVVLIGPGAL